MTDEPAKQSPEPSEASTAPVGARPGFFNLVLTVGLLVMGAINVFGSLAEYLHPGMLITGFLAQLSAADPNFPQVSYTTTAATDITGGLLLSLQGANFGLILWWSFARLRAKKFSFWVPLLGAAISSVLTMIALTTLMLADPTVRHALSEFIEHGRPSL